MKSLNACLIMIFLTTSMLIIFSGCNDDVADDNYVTFSEEQISDYLLSQPEKFSEFTGLLQKAGVFNLLKSYGTFTCFIPDNEAMQAYYKKYNTSLSEMSEEELKEVAYYHLIDSKVYETSDFVEGRIVSPNMSGRYIDITFSGYASGENVIKVNKTSPILEKDYEVRNGVVHTIGEVLEGVDILLWEVIVNDERFSIFSEALIATGLNDSLSLIEDETYIQRGTTTPTKRMYGYTALIETDLVFHENKIYDLNDLKAYAKNIYDKMYPESAGITDVTNRENSLNRFIAYHLIDRWAGTSEFSFAFNCISGQWLREYFETMAPNTMFEVACTSDSPTKLYINRQANGESLHFDEENSNNIALNGVYHAIDKILVYDETVENDVLNKRLRFDMGSLFSELTNNNIRWKETKYFYNGYFDKMICSEETYIRYAAPNPTWNNLYGDEWETQQGTWYDITIITPPIPAGTWEVRYGFTAVSHRGVAQIYFDDEACGIPLDIRMAGTDWRIGWIADNEAGGGAENDKTMRNRGYMKGGASWMIKNLNVTGRDASNTLRRIVTTKSFDKTESHKLRLKSVYPGTFHCDIIEFMPTGEKLENEDIY